MNGYLIDTNVISKDAKLQASYHLVSVALLRDGIYELRASLHGVNYRILYFFHGTVAAIVSHGIVKTRAVPPKEIDRAVERKKLFQANPSKHRYEGNGK